MDGADRRAWHLFEGLIQCGFEGRFVARRITMDGTSTTSYHKTRSLGNESKLGAALIALATNRDYWQFKILTPAIAEAAKTSTAFEWDAVLIHFLYSTPLLRLFGGRQLRLVVDTHNYDPLVFAGFRDAARNPLTRLLCSRAIKTSRRALAGLPRGTVMVHVSQSDADAYKRDRPDLTHLVVENGCKVQPRLVTPNYLAEDRKRLLFVGSLSAQMNQDALRHLAERFWPQLKDLARVCVVGSNPPAAISNLCREHGWELRPNVDEHELEECYSTAHFSLLPFSYGAGSKLKLMEACGRGVPALTTSAGVTGLSYIPDLVQVSDDPARWRMWLQDCRPPTAEALERTLKFAGDHSWPQLAARLAKIVSDAPITTI